MRITTVPSRDPADYAFSHVVRARFAETDAMGIVHHASYLPWLEETRVAYLRSIGHPYTGIRAEGIDVAVIEVWARYLRPARFDDAICVHLRVAEATRSTFQVAYLLESGGEPLLLAVTVHACLDAASGRPVRLPGWVQVT